MFRFSIRPEMNVMSSMDLAKTGPCDRSDLPVLLPETLHQSLCWLPAALIRQRPPPCPVMRPSGPWLAEQMQHLQRPSLTYKGAQLVRLQHSNGRKIQGAHLGAAAFAAGAVAFAEGAAALAAGAAFFLA